MNRSRSDNVTKSVRLWGVILTSLENFLERFKGASRKIEGSFKDILKGPYHFFFIHKRFHLSERDV